MIETKMNFHRRLKEIISGKEVYYLSAIMIITFLARIYGIRWGLPYEYHPDEPEILKIAMRFGTGDFNPHWFVYPSFSLYVLFIAEALYSVFGLIFGLFSSTSDIAIKLFSDPTGFYLVGRFLQVAMGTLTVFIVYIIGTKVYCRSVGILAALFLSLGYSHVIASHFIRPDIQATLLIMLSFLSIIYVYLEGEIKHYFLSGLFIGLTMATRIEMGLIVLPLLLAHINRSMDERIKFIYMLINKKLILSLSSILTFFFIGSPYSFIDFKSFFAFQAGYYQQAKLGWLGIEGFTTMYYQVLTNYLKDDLGIPLLVLSLSGLVFTLYRHDRKDLLIVIFPIAYYFFMGRYPYQISSRWIVTNPFLIVLAANFLVAIFQNYRFPKKFQITAIVIVATLIILEPTYRIAQFDYLLSQKDNRTLAKEWIEANILTGSRIALESYGPPLTPDRDSYLEILKRGDFKDDNYYMSEWFKSRRYVSETLEKNYYSATHGKYALLAYDKTYGGKIKYSLKILSVAGAYPASYYREDGLDYVILSSYTYKPYLDKKEYYPKTAKNYISIFTEFELIKKLEPEKRWGPTIEVYKVR